MDTNFNHEQSLALINEMINRARNNVKHEGVYSLIFMLNIPVIMVMVGLGQFISACIYRNKMWYAIAALTWAGAIVCVFLPVYLQFIDFATCMILGFVLPGHILIHQAKKSHV